MFSATLSFPVNLNIVNGQITAGSSDGSDTGTLIGGNLFIGGNAGNDSLAGNRNVGIGQNTLNDLHGVLGSGNTGLGFRAGPLLDNGSGNVLIGSQVATSLTNTVGRSSNNTVVGSSTASAATFLLNTTILGEGAGSSQTGYSGCTLIGANADCTASNLYNSTAIGYNAKVNVTNGFVLGNGQAFVGIAQSSPAYTLDLGNISQRCGTRYAASYQIPFTPGNTNDIVLFNQAGAPAWLDTGGTVHAIGSGSGSVTSIVGIGGITCTPNPITTTGTISLANTTVTAGTYSFPINMDVNTQGQITGVASDGFDSGFVLAIGSGAGNVSCSGTSNIAYGAGSLASNLTGSNCVAIGVQALASLNGTNNCIAIGYRALLSAATGTTAIAIGTSCLSSNSGADNNSVGHFSLQNLASGTGNTAMGSNAGNNATSGSNNVFIGFQSALNRASYNNCVIIGANADASSTGLSNAAAIGYNTAIAVSNGFNLGNGAYVGISKSSPAYTLDLANVGSQCGIRFAATSVTPTTPGNVNDIVLFNNAGAPSWVDTGGTVHSLGSGTVTSITAGTGLTGGTITTSGTIALSTPVSLANGGTNASLTASNGGIVWSNASQMQILAGTSTARQMLQSGATATPAWSTATWPATTTINQILYSSATNTVTGLTATVNAVLTTGTSGIPVLTSLASNGQLIIGSGTGAPAAATLTQGTGITITNAANSITVALSTPVSLANGGTNASLTASNGGIFYSTASAAAILSGTATANQVLLSGASTTPAWSTATYPATTTANQILYSSANNTVTGLTSANNALVVTNGSGVPSLTSTLPSITIKANDGNALRVETNTPTTIFTVDTLTPKVLIDNNVPLFMGPFASSYSYIQLGGGDSFGYFWTYFPTVGDSINLGYNYYIDPTGTAHIFDTANGTSTLLCGYSKFIFKVGATNTAPSALIQIDSNGIYPSNDNAISCGKSGNRWSAVWAANGTIQTSDSSKKKNIQSSSLGLDFINQLKPKSWNWKDGPDTTKTYHGFIYEDVATVAPQDFGGIWPAQASSDQDPNNPAKTINNPGVNGLSYSSLIAPLVNAIQALTARVAALEAKLGVTA